MTDKTPETWPEKLRSAARWFDMFDELASYLEVENTMTRQKYLLSSMLSGTEIQDDLRELADLLETGKIEQS